MQKTNKISISEWLRHARSVLSNSTTPQLDAELLVCKALGIERVEIQLRLDDLLTEPQEELLINLLEQRQTGKPMAYITGAQSFGDFEVEVNTDVLIPRPTSEAIVLAAVGIAKRIKAKTIYEIGTGSGVIAIALARQIPDTEIIASDISAAALRVAEGNVARLGLSNQIKLVESDLGAHIAHAELLVANLPYLPEGLEVSTEVANEPGLALWSGADGLEHYRKLLSNTSFDAAVLEIGADQYPALTAWVMQNLPDKRVEAVLDLDQSICGVLIS